MKHDAIVSQGIPILERVELPEELIPDDSRVEIDAKITAGWFNFFSLLFLRVVILFLASLS
jgi:GTP cyclohydrolase II